MQNKRPIYIIEHLEPEIFEWCFIEYEHISHLVGKENLWVTNLKTEENKKKLERFAKVFSESISKLNIEKSKICVLDPEAEKTLSPAEKAKFEYYVFGGILGDYPPKKRTKKELTKFLPDCDSRNIGKKQMSTDNAVYTTFQIVENKKKFENLKFKDKISLEINEIESVDLPYRYNLDENGKIFMSSKILEYLKNKQGF